jgi:hypothetical protein
MTGALLFGISVLLAVSIATLIVAVLALRTAREYVDLAEERLERLHETQSLLLLLMREKHHTPREEASEQEERVLVRRGAARERGGRGRRAGEPRASREAGRKIDALKREILESHAAEQRQPPSPATPPEDTAAPAPRAQRLPDKPREETRRPRPANFPETRALKPSKVAPEPKASGRVVGHPHPDDDVSREERVPGEAPSSDAPIEMFRKHYDRYLENYEGYVKLAERIHRMRDASGAPPGSPERREQEEKLRRVADGIKRTITRLDILEGYNPGLATDDRISRRARIARSHAGLDISNQLP